MHKRFQSLPDLGGRTALVTGASDGVGLRIATALAGAGAHVLAPVRKRGKGERAAETIRESVPGASVRLLDMDLADLGSVNALAGELLSEAAPVHLLVLNAGVVMLGHPQRRVTTDGCELHFQTNYLAQRQLTLDLLPLLRDGGATVVLQGSIAARSGRLRHADLQFEHGYRPLAAYARSKVALGLFGTELARRSEVNGWGLRVVQCHPGVVPATGIAATVRARRSGGGHARLAQRLGNSPEQAARTALAALSLDVPAGWAFVPSGMLQFSGEPRLARMPRRVTDEVAAHRLWEASSALLERSATAPGA